MNDSNEGDGDKGNVHNGGDPQGPDPDIDPLGKLRFTCRVSGGPIAQWAIEGTITAADMMRLDGRTIEPVRQLF